MLKRVLSYFESPTVQLEYQIHLSIHYNITYLEKFLLSIFALWKHFSLKQLLNSINLHMC